MTINPDKLIIALYGKGGIGKSTTCKLVKDKLLKLGGLNVFRNEHVRANGHDINIVLQQDTLKIGIETEGDPGTPLEDRLSDFVNIGCQIIVCTCRTYGKTVKVIQSFRPKYDYDIVWINQNNLESDYDEGNLRKLANEKTSKFIIEILKRRFPKLGHNHATQT